MTGIKMRHVGYQGGTPAMSDVMAGHVPVAFMNLTAIQPAVESGKVRVLAVGSAKRVPSLPNVPTLAESGVTGFESTSWMGLMAPAGTPPQVIERIQQALAGMQAPAVLEFARKQGAEPAVSTPDQMRAILKADVANYGKVIRQAGISAE
jgi:tripartite-type tricarboxylate transporter receptor subunit TctC